MVSDEYEFRHLNPTFGSSRIASSAYQRWPTKNFIFNGDDQIKHHPLLAYLKFENRLRMLHPQGL
jgi:hypothetical protein